MIGRIHLKNAEFRGFHGCHPGEGLAGQRFLVDLVLTADIGAAAATDDLSAAVDYERVLDTCRKLVEGTRHRLIETLCRRIGEAMLRDWPQVTKVEVTVKKPDAPMRGVLDYVAVEASLERKHRLRRPRQ